MKVLFDGESYRVENTDPTARLRIVCLCCDDPQQNYLIAQLASRFNLVGAIIESNRQQLRRLWATKNYVTWLYRRWHSLRQKITGRRQYREKYFAPLINGVQPPAKYEVEWIGSKKTIEILNRLRPDVTIVSGTMYVPKSIIDCAGLIINVHGGFLPDYRGNHCIFFAYYKKDYEKIGATLHVLTKELDKGDIIEVVRPPIYPHDNDEHLYCRSLHKAMLRLFAIIDSFEKGELRIACESQAGKQAAMFRHRDRKPRYDLAVALRRLVRKQCVPHIPQNGDF